MCCRCGSCSCIVRVEGDDDRLGGAERQGPGVMRRGRRPADGRRCEVGWARLVHADGDGVEGPSVRTGVAPRRRRSTTSPYPNMAVDLAYRSVCGLLRYLGAD